jgi:hypothetical protein
MNPVKATIRTIQALITAALDATAELTDGLAEAIRRTLATLRAALPTPDDTADHTPDTRPWTPLQVTELGDKDLIRFNGGEYQVVGHPMTRTDPDAPWDGVPTAVDVHLRCREDGEEHLLTFAAQTRMLAVPYMTVPDDPSSLSGPGAQRGAAA